MSQFLRVFLPTLLVNLQTIRTGIEFRISLSLDQIGVVTSEFHALVYY